MIIVLLISIFRYIKAKKNLTTIAIGGPDVLVSGSDEFVSTTKVGIISIYRHVSINNYFHNPDYIDIHGTVYFQ